MGGDDIIDGGADDDDIRIQAGNSLIDGGGGWNSLEIDDRTSAYVVAEFVADKTGSVYGYSDDGALLYRAGFDNIDRIVAVPEMDFRFYGGNNNERLKLYEMPTANPDTGIFELIGGAGADELQFHSVEIPELGIFDPTFDEFNEHFYFNHVDGSMSDFDLLSRSDDEVIGKLVEFEEVSFKGVDLLLMDIAANTESGVTITGSSEDDDIYGSFGDDLIFGSGGNDDISAGSGDDLVYAQDVNLPSSGNDWDNISPGTGNDVIYFTNPGFSEVRDEHFSKRGQAEYENEFEGLYDVEFGPHEGNGLQGIINGNPFSASFGIHGGVADDDGDRAITITDLEDFTSKDILVGVNEISATFDGDAGDSPGRIFFSIDWDSEIITPFQFYDDGDVNEIYIPDYSSAGLTDWYTDDEINGGSGDDWIGLWGGGSDTVYGGTGDDEIWPDAWQLDYERDSTSRIDGGDGSDTVHVDTIGGDPNEGRFVVEKLDDISLNDILSLEGSHTSETDMTSAFNWIDDRVGSADLSSYRIFLETDLTASSSTADDNRDYTVYLGASDADGGSGRAGIVTFTDSPEIVISAFYDVETLEFNDLWGTGIDEDTGVFGADSERWARFDLTGEEVTAYVIRNGAIVDYQANGYELVSGGSGSDTLIGGLEADYITTNGGDDQVYGLGGDDVIEISGYGDVVVDTGEGADEIVVGEDAQGSIDITTSGAGNTLLWNGTTEGGVSVNENGDLLIGDNTYGLSGIVREQMVLDAQLNKYVVSDSGFDAIIFSDTDEDQIPDAGTFGSDHELGDYLTSVGHDGDNFIVAGRGADTIELLGGADQAALTSVMGDILNFDQSSSQSTTYSLSAINYNVLEGDRTDDNWDVLPQRIDNLGEVNVQVTYTTDEYGSETARVSYDGQEFDHFTSDHSVQRFETSGYHYDFLIIEAASEWEAPDNWDYTDGNFYPDEVKGVFVLLDTDDPSGLSQSDLFDKLAVQYVDGNVYAPDDFTFDGQQANSGPGFFKNVLDGYADDVSVADNSWETQNVSYGDELVFAWAHEDVEITDYLNGYYEVEYVGEGVDRGKVVEFTDI